MELVYRASRGGDFIGDMVYDFPIPSAIVLGIVLSGVVTWWLRKRLPNKPTDENPPLAGTAQVLSVEFSRTVEKRRYVAWIELSVHTPGREPYMTVVKEPVGPKEVKAGVQAGGTVAVAVDPANPQSVWLEPPYGAPPSSPGSIMMDTIGPLILVVLLIAALVGLIILGLRTGNLWVPQHRGG
jgi:hypothetical protein